MWKSNIKQNVLFSVFKIYNSQGEFLGIAAGNIDSIHREWAPRGGVKFVFEMKNYSFVDMTNVIEAGHGR